LYLSGRFPNRQRMSRPHRPPLDYTHPVQYTTHPVQYTAHRSSVFYQIRVRQPGRQRSAVDPVDVKVARHDVDQCNRPWTHARTT
jgi:hypothetical protein